METKLECGKPSCVFQDEELTTLHKVAFQEVVAFPKWALGLLITILIGLVGSNGAIWLAFSERALAKETSSALSQHNVRLTSLEASLPKDFPPTWFQKRFEELATQVSENNKILTDVRIEVRTLSAKRNDNEKSSTP